MNLNKLKKESEHAKLPEASLYILKKFQQMFSELKNKVNKLQKHSTISCKLVDTIGGSATEEFLDSDVKPEMRCIVTMTELGASPVSVLAAKCEMGKVVITFSADPSDDHKLTYHVCQ